MNLIGLPGVGKTAMLSKLVALGFPVVHYDAQSFAKSVNDQFTPSVYSKIVEANNENKPLIIVVEELDKVPEITGQGENTSSVVGTINQILSDGIVSYSGSIVDAHNVMVLTTMNFAPNEMERFTEDVLSEKKSFYDLTIEDMQKFNEWIKTQPSARYKILSHLFRSNTVRRMAPFTVIMQPLLEDTYREIIRGVVREAIERNTTGKNAGKRVAVDIDQSVIDFLYRETVYAPSGAGETVLRADAIIDQLINFSIKAQNGDHDDSIDRPRRAKISIDPNSSQAHITITPYVYHHPKLDPLPSFDIESEFDRSSGLFMPPAELAVVKPIYVKPGTQVGEKPITQKQTMEFRYPLTKNATDGLRESIESQLLGQSAAIEMIENEMNKYMAISKPTTKEPMFKVLSGFPGIGKSEIVKVTATHLKLPVVKVNMQQFISDNPKTVDDFVSTVNSEINQRQKEIQAAGGKFIFLLEELDKAYEIDPKTGALMNRPVMAIIKDLLNEGKINISSQSMYGSANRSTLDISNAYTFVTMNFSVDRFGFTADPRMTTIDDVIAAWQRLNTSVAGIKQLLGSMFLPETVSRVMSQFVIMKPLTADDYRGIISRQVDKVVRGRLFDQKGRNIGKIRIVLSPRYKQYLFNETVIPSEGARSTVVRAQGLISTDLEKAISALPKSKFGAKPLFLTLDFFPGTTEVVVRAQVDDANIKAARGEAILRRPIALTFPRIDIKGKIPQERLKTSAHELGHALIAARLGLRIDQVVVVPTLPGAGGYVKFKGDQSSATEMMANVYSVLASRAMERIVLSKDPRSANSVLEISAGPSQDIKQATLGLFNMIYELGFDPNGGTIDRNFIIGLGKYADYASIPPEMAVKLGNILRMMENQVLDDLLKAHSQDWYVEKTIGLARKGGMDEKEFYALIEYSHPGENSLSYGRTFNIRSLFQKVIKEKPSALKKAQQQRRGLLNETVEETVERYLGQFAGILESQLHPEIKAEAAVVSRGTSVDHGASPTDHPAPTASGHPSCKDIFSKK
jgi:broad-specificity NMP kinase